MKGLVHIYCGDGKGKTTAAIGSAVRAAGRGMGVLVCRFLKTDDSGEVAGLSLISGVRVLPCDRNFGFSWEMTPAQKKDAALYYTEKFLKTWEMAAGQDGEGGCGGGDGSGGEGGCDMLILDEIIGACSLGFINEEIVINALRQRPAHLEVILTGRGPSSSLMECADYVTEMVLGKHPFERGISAREGIEY